VSQIATVDRRQLLERVGRLPAALLEQVDQGLRAVLSL
jgi:mRNA-degrading endonuclease toxin of MazEF toxin-antitoxin module